MRDRMPLIDMFVQHSGARVIAPACSLRPAVQPRGTGRLPSPIDRIEPMIATKTPCRLAVRMLTLAALVATFSGCGALRPRHAPPAAVEPQVQVPGMPDVRVWGDAFSPAFQADIVESVRQEQRSGLFREGDTVSILAISGGGGDGAFGAGLLYGWTQAGNRPSFKMVTGVSTGALTAPFAFLGPAYDEQLKKVYTTISSQDILKLKSFFSWLRGDSISLNDPLGVCRTFGAYGCVGCVRADEGKVR